MPKVNIGRLGDQPIKIQDPMVSGRHAVLLINGPSNLELVDIGSTNGTFIYRDGQYIQLQPNKKYPVTPDTFVRFGPDTQMHVRRLIPEEKKIDISHLRNISDNYNSKKLELQSSQQSIQGLRGMQVAVVVTGTLIGTGLKSIMHTGNAIIDNVVPVVLPLILIVIGILLLNRYIKKKLHSISLELQENEKFYGINYVCPLCRHSYRGQLYENILAAGSCPKCNGKYIDSTIPSPTYTS